MKKAWGTAVGSSFERLVLIALSDFTDDSGGSCFPSVATLSQMCCMTERGVQKIIRRLESAGHVARVSSLGRTSNSYQLTLNTVQGKMFNPEPHSPQPRTGVHPTPNTVHPNPEPRSPDPSVIHQDPPSDPSSLEKLSTIRGSSAIPMLLSTPEFRAAWVMWLEHLKQRRKSPSLHAQDLQLRKLALLGPERAVVTIYHSVENNWQGLYEPNTNSTTRKQGADRNAGTANSKRIGQYDGLGKILPVPNGGHTGSPGAA